MCERWLERAPRGHARPHRHPPALPPRCLHALRAPRRHRWALPQRGVCLLPLPPNVRTADVVYVTVHALERSAEVWVRAPPRRTRGCSTRVWCTTSSPPAYLRVPPCPSVRAIPVRRVRVHTPPTSLLPSRPRSRHPHPTYFPSIHTCAARPLPLPCARTHIHMSLTLVCFLRY
ncbi:hypothetical protein FB451DRAFT_475211 [Mycena latifolia]|nr:hypothetical protein FB451DRAFT_475211 [Mycena latifolia]